MNSLPQAVDFLGFPLRPVDSEALIATLLTWGLEPNPDGGPRTATYLNAHTCNLSHSIPDLADCLRRSDLLYADGMSIVHAARLLGSPVPERVSAADFFERFLAAASSKGVPLAFIGGEPGVAEACAAGFRAAIAGLDIRFVSHGRFAPGSPEEDSVLARLKGSGARIALVGMGSPRQELLARDRGTGTGCRVIWCVGALFEYGVVRRRAPLWMRRAGLEWMHRLVQEPRRLAGRYLIGNVRFALRIVGEKLRRRRAGPRPHQS